jgi:hypothetical protein
MSDSPSNSGTAEVSGNVRVETLPDQITVTMPAERSAREFIVCGFLFIVVLVVFDDSIFHYLAGAGVIPVALAARIGPWIKPVPSLFSPFASLAIWCIVMGQILFDSLRGLLGGRQVLRCTRTRIEIVDIDFGRVWRRRFFSRSKIDEIVFGAPGFRLGSRRGMSFVAAGDRVRVLPGLKAPEAQRVLKEMKRLGFDVVSDPHLLRMVELEQTRRKYVFPLFR